jgi:hypothetical protein
MGLVNRKDRLTINKGGKVAKASAGQSRVFPGKQRNELKEKKNVLGGSKKYNFASPVTRHL